MQASDKGVARVDAAVPVVAGKWLTRLGTAELLVFTLWAVRTVFSGADFSALAGFFYLLPLWAVVGLLACYHLIRSPALRWRAALYLLAPAGLFVLVSAREPGASAALTGRQLVLIDVLLVASAMLWRKRTQFLRVRSAGEIGKPLHLAVLLIQVGLSLIWLLVTLYFGGISQVDQLLRQNEQLAVAAMLFWLGSALFCLCVAVYALLGLVLPFGQSLRLMFVLQLLMTAVLITMLSVPGTLAFIALMTALPG